VERFDPRRAAEDTQELTAHARRGDDLLVFPEGTFGPTPGLLPFRLGAFLTAAQAQVPVVPVVLRGNRAALPDGSWRLRRVRLEVEVLPPVPQPSSGDLLGRAARLRDAAHAAMAERVDAGEEER
jgi:1-acyl-sn-glycerol-3-phosphate acyltransferase